MVNELVKNQHVLPGRSIERFCNKDGVVEVYRINGGNTFFAKPRNKIFCVNRLWDQRAEQGYGKEIEDSYQSLVDKILNSQRRLLLENENEIASMFYALWCFRSVIDQQDELLSGSPIGITDGALTKEQKLNIELKHGIYAEESGEIPVRFKRGLSMQIAIEDCLTRNPNLKWYVAESELTEFVVSDSPNKNFTIPLTPHLCLICNFNVPLLSDEQILSINKDAIVNSKSYYFARQLSAT